MHFYVKGSMGFTSISKGSMAQKKVKNSCLMLYNSCTITFIKDNLFPTLTHRCFVAVKSKVSILKK